MSVFKRNTNKETNEKNGGFTNQSSPEGSQLEWTGAGELPEGAAYVPTTVALIEWLTKADAEELTPIQCFFSTNAEGIPTFMGASGNKLNWLVTVAASAGFGLFG